jgi:hypothetical protein
MGVRSIIGATFLSLAMLAAAPSAWAGPPFQTDDPEPIDYRNFEYYTFGTADGTAVAINTAGPAAEFNWGALPNVHLHIVVALAEVFPSNNPALAPSVRVREKWDWATSKRA